MKIISDIEQNSEEWREIRRGKITGSKLKDLVVKRGTGKKIGFYQLVADRLGIAADDEPAMERGHRLEEEAISCFQNETGKLVTLAGFCVSDFSDSIALSPDGLIGEGNAFTEAVEVKCLGSARHIEAIVTNAIPDEYELQVLQYFIVIEELQGLNFVFYDPRIVAKPYHCITVYRSEVEEEVRKYRQYQLDALKEIDDIVSDLEFN